jgi:MFS family permease
MTLFKTKEGHDPYAVLRIRDFRSFIGSRFLLTFAIQMQSVIVGWQVYEITRDPFALGLIGLAEAIPNISVALFAGFVADRINRRHIVIISSAFYILAAISLFAICWLSPAEMKSLGITTIFSVIAFSGVARAFYYPAQASYMAQIVPKELYPNSSTWNSTIWHIAAVAGPATGGLVYGFAGVQSAYAVVVLMSVLAFMLFLTTRKVAKPQNGLKPGLVAELKEGIRFVFGKQELLGALSLDMFAVLFGGAVALLPVFADQVLKCGPEGLGFLRAAPMVGAVVMSFLLAWYPPVRNSGWKLLTGVAGFGLSTILFALSGNFWLSLFFLFLSGMFDNISVVIRHTIIQVHTPDEMRGRVASINSIFIGSSNEIGAFESGLAARLLGLIPSVVFGGSMTLLIVALTGRLAPRLRKLQLDKL